MGTVGTDRVGKGVKKEGLWMNWRGMGWVGKVLPVVSRYVPKVSCLPIIPWMGGGETL